MKDPRNFQRPGAPALRPTASPDGETSDLVDLQAIAESTRASVRTAVVNPAELSGVVPRRDSVVGARVAGAGTGIPPFVWGLIGCLGVLAAGLALLWYLAPAGLLAPATATAAAPPRRSPSSAPSPTATAGGPQIVPLPSRAVEPPPETRPPPAHVEKEKAAHRVGAAVGKSFGHGSALAAPASALASAPSERAAEPAVAEAPEATTAAEKPGVLDTLLGNSAGGAATGDPRKDVDAALEELQPKVHECFRRFQIRGVAQVKMTVSPSGSVESPTLSGDFDGTPTGECVLRELASAALPPFKGSPVSVSHAYVFR